MSDYREEKFFGDGMDFDSEIRLIQLGSYLFALNLSPESSNQGVLTNTKGNELVPYQLPAGQNKCIGTLRDIKRNAIIYFVYNTLENHSILHYFCATNTIEEILAPFTSGALIFNTSFLLFTEFNKIHSSNIIDDILLWTDGNVSPRKLNIKRAKEFMQQLTPSATVDPYSNLIATGILPERTQFLNSIKYAPVDKPTHVLGYDSTRKTNFIRGFMIQVRYRWIYDDSEPSAWSTGSYISLPLGEENITGQFAVTNANNYLEVTVGTGHPTVKKIEVAFRFGNLEAWYKIDTTIDKFDKDNQVVIPSLTNYSFRFYNDKVLTPIGLEENIKNFDAIPLLSKTQEIIDGNRLVYSNNLQGYDNPTLDVTVTPQFLTTSFSAASLYAGPATPSATLFSIAAWAGYPTRNQLIYIPMNLSLIPVGTVISFTLRRTDCATFNGCGTYDNLYEVAYTVTETDKAGGPFTLQQSLFDAIAATAYPIVQTQGTVATSPVMLFVATQASAAAVEFTEITNFAVVPPTQKIMSWKKGAIGKFGIVYYDFANRDGGVVTNDDLSVYVQYYPEYSPNGPLSANFTDKVIMSVEIRHQPPIWAERYQIVYAGDNLRKYVQFLIKADASPETFQLTPSGNFEIKLDYLTDYITKERIQTTVAYSFEAGDRLRFINNAQNYVTEYVETTVLDFDTSTNLLTVQPFDLGLLINNMTPQPGTTQAILCELFAYKPTTDNLPYFEIGEVWDIIDAGLPTRAHAANQQNQIINVQNAILLLTRGDCYIYRRYFNKNTLPTFVESEFFSDYILGSNNIDISRLQAVTNSKQKRYEQEIRYGGRYFPGTLTNLLLSFGASDYDNVETTYGPVNRVITVGEVLKVLQTKKITSIYIDRNMIFTPDGQKQIALSDKVLGTKYPSDTDYGCAHPESVFKDDRQVFWFDVNSGAFIQDSANGPFEISSYKASTYFQNKAREIQNKANVFVYCQVDNMNNTVIVSFVDESGLGITTSETILYYQQNNRWRSFASYIPDYYGQNAMVFVSFRDGALWRHNSDNVPRNNFYGVQYDSIIEFVGNVNPYEVKVFDSLAVDSNEVWAALNIGDIRVPPNNQYPSGMESRLIAAKFRNKEGVWYSEFMRDANTPNHPSVQIALLEGRKLRDHVILVRLINSSTGEVKILGAIVYSTLSRIS